MTRFIKAQLMKNYETFWLKVDLISSVKLVGYKMLTDGGNEDKLYCADILMDNKICYRVFLNEEIMILIDINYSSLEDGGFIQEWKTIDVYGREVDETDRR